MSIPLSSTTITVLGKSSSLNYVEPYGEDVPTDWQVLATNVRAHIGSPRGSEIIAGGAQAVGIYNLQCDFVASAGNSDESIFDHNCRVQDDKTGRLYEIVWIKDRTGFGPKHTAAGLRVVEGLV